MSLLPSSSYTPQASFSRSGKVKQTVYNITDYGAAGSESVYDAVLSGTTLTSATANFSPSDVGKTIFAVNTANTVTLTTTTITAYTSSTQVTVGTTGTNGSNYTIYWGSDDTSAIQAAMNAAGPTGATVFFPPGNYIISNTLLWDKESETNSQLAPSLLGAAGRSGASNDFQYIGVVQLVCAPTFPVGEYVIDYLGPTAQDRAIVGTLVSGFVLQCNNKGAGIRIMNGFCTSWRDIVINGGITPNPANPGAFGASSSNTGAFQSSGKPTQNSFMNTMERIYIHQCAKDGFQMAAGAGSYDLMNNCEANACGRYGFNINQKCMLVECLAQANAVTNGQFGADFKIDSYECILIACQAFAGKPIYGNGIKVAGGAAAVAKIIGCTFYGPTNPGSVLTEDIAAIVNIQGDLQNVHFIGCHFITGNSTNTSDFVYLSANASGRAIFEGCSFITEYGSALTNVPVNENSNYGVLSFVNCSGINPVTVKTWGTITNAQQTLQIGVTGGIPTGGTFTLTFGGQTTSALAYNASAATIQTALQALSSIGAGNVVCSGGNIISYPVRVTFQGTLANAAQAAITGDVSGLTPGSSYVLTVTQVTPGGSAPTLDRKNGSLHTATLGGDISPTLNNGIVIGDEWTFEFTQDGTGSRVITWPSNVVNGPVLSTTASAVDLIKFTWDGSKWRRVAQGLSRAVSVTEGGTGNSSLTAYAVMAGGTASTGALQQVSGLGSSGQILTSNGAGSLPTWQNAISGFANPMTTLGDIIYEDATPTPARLAGNTTTTKKFLSQTGNGTISATPSWDVVTGYTLQFAAAATSPSDAQTLYLGAPTAATLGSQGFQRIYIPKTGTVKAIYVNFANTGTLGSNETSTIYFRLNQTTDTTISSSVTNDSADTAFNNTGLSIAVSAGDYFEIKWITPTWGTNPTNVRVSGTVYIE